MKLLCWNVNGLRAIEKKGFSPWFEKESPDILCLQEIKAQPEQLSPYLRNIPGYHSFWNPAEKKGYSGVATFSKKKPIVVKNGFGREEFDNEGRI
jgi:exodeoxyribonuclease-3